MAMRISNVGYFFRESFRSSKRNRVMSIASIGTVAAALLIFGIFMLLILNVNKIVDSVVDKVEIKVFLNDDVTSIQQTEMEKNIKSYSGVKSVRFESKEQALENYKKMLGDDADLANGLSEKNPLPACFIIKVSDAEDVTPIAQKASTLPGVYKIVDGQETVTKLIKIINVVQGTSLTLMIILGVIAVFLISNTIKITVFTRKREIGIMKYIGATDWFIKWPFLIEGLTLGFIGSVISLLILGLGYRYITNAVDEGTLLFSLVPAAKVMHSMILEFLGVGMFIGGAGSLFSMKKFLAV